MKPKVGPKKGMAKKMSSAGTGMRNGGAVKRMRGGGMAAKPKVGPKKPPGMRNGGMAKKEVPEANKGLAKLPKNVRNKMGFMADGGAVKPKPKEGPKKMRNGGAAKKMAKGGAVKKTAKGGAAVRSSSSKSL